MIRIGIDLGGTKTECVALGADGEILLRRREPTARDYAASLAQIASMVRAAEAELGETAHVGIGHPGSSNPSTGLMRNANSTWLNGKPFAADISAALDREVRCANDADCFALSEATDGAGAGHRIVFGVILGTGVGGGIVVDGRLLDGAQGIAGEWGHNPLPGPSKTESPGPDCWCGKQGCIETWLSGPGLRRDHLASTGADLPAEDIVTAALAGENAAIATLDRYVDRLARSLAGVINLIDPHVIVLGGGMSQIPDLAERTQSALPAHVFCDDFRTRVRINQHGDSSGVRGAAWLWPADRA